MLSNFFNPPCGDINVERSHFAFHLNGTWSRVPNSNPAAHLFEQQYPRIKLTLYVIERHNNQWDTQWQSPHFLAASRETYQCMRDLFSDEPASNFTTQTEQRDELTKTVSWCSQRNFNDGFMQDYCVANAHVSLRITSHYYGNDLSRAHTLFASIPAAIILHPVEFMVQHSVDV